MQQNLANHKENWNYDILKKIDVAGTHCIKHNKIDSEALHFFLLYTELGFKIIYVGGRMCSSWNC